MASPASNTVGSSKGIFRTVILLAIFIAILVGGFVHTMMRPRVLSDAALRANNAFLFDKVRDIGAFSLLDDGGKPFTPASLQGHWSLLFFGYTFCPDVCPTTMAVLSQFYTKLRPEYLHDTQIVMVSVDPARDNPAKLHEYVNYFNSKFLGVTGEFIALQQFSTALSIPFSKVPGGGDNYVIAHSGNIALLDANGHYVGFFKEPHDLNQLLMNYQSIRATRD
jgi:protein SCO1/2